MIWAFVDYENVGSLESLDLEQYQRLIIFCGPRHRKLNLGEIPTSSFCHLELIRMASTGNNNLDFHLTFYLGVHHLEAGKDVTFHVISNDKGFDGVIQHLVEMGRKCSRVSRAKKKTTKKVAAKKTVAKKAATKKVAAKKTAKKVAKKAAKKAAINKEVGQRKYSASSISEMLANCQERSRPTRRDKLVNWISNKLGDEKMLTLDIYEDLLEAGIVIESGGAITYGFSGADARQ